MIYEHRNRTLAAVIFSAAAISNSARAAEGISAVAPPRALKTIQYVTHWSPSDPNWDPRDMNVLVSLRRLDVRTLTDEEAVDWADFAKHVSATADQVIISPLQDAEEAGDIASKATALLQAGFVGDPLESGIGQFLSQNQINGVVLQQMRALKIAGDHADKAQKLAARLAAALHTEGRAPDPTGGSANTNVVFEGQTTSAGYLLYRIIRKGSEPDGILDIPYYRNHYETLDAAVNMAEALLQNDAEGTVIRSRLRDIQASLIAFAVSPKLPPELRIKASKLLLQYAPEAAKLAGETLYAFCNRDPESRSVWYVLTGFPIP